MGSSCANHIGRKAPSSGASKIIYGTVYLTLHLLPPPKSISINVAMYCLDHLGLGYEMEMDVPAMYGEVSFAISN